MVWDIRERTFRFAIATIHECEKVHSGRTADIVVRQILRSATSIGANIEEAAGSQSRADFARKFCIALGEARETSYWLRILREIRLASPSDIDPLLDESRQLARILGAIVSSIRGTRKRKDTNATAGL